MQGCALGWPAVVLPCGWASTLSVCLITFPMLKRCFRGFPPQRSKKGSEKGSGEGFWGRVLRRVLRRGLAVGFTVQKGSEKGSQKGF